MPEPCAQANPWVVTFAAVRQCVRSLGHGGTHRDQLGARWTTGQDQGQAHGSTDSDGPGPYAPLAPQALATPHPPPPSDRERELEYQLDRERQAHARTHGQLVRALIQVQALKHRQGAGGE